MAEYLYHYTNIEALALILKNRTIRFNSLDRMDDLQEQRSADAQNIGKLVYVSSWTDDAQESIPMWNMYASLKSGIRIKLRTNPFKLREFDIDAIQKTFSSTTIDNRGCPPPMLIPLSEMMCNSFYAMSNPEEGILYKVEYVDDPDKLYPSVVKNTGKSTHIDFTEMGKYKNTRWAFQKEWRYLFWAIPVEYNNIKETESKLMTYLKNVISGKIKQPFPYYDMPISDEAFADMTITISPKTSAGNRLIVETLCKAYNPAATIEASTLCGLI